MVFFLQLDLGSLPILDSEKLNIEHERRSTGNDSTSASRT